MQKEGKIGPYEAVSLITITICSKVLLSSPRELIALVGTAVWYASLVETLTAIIAFIFIYFLMKRFPGKGLVEVSELVLGKVLGIIGMMVLAIVFYIKGVLYCRELVEALKAFEYPMTPPSFILLFILFSIGITAYLGLEALTRMAGLWSILLLIGYLSIFILAIPIYNTAYLFPIMGYGLKKTIINGLIRSSTYGEVIILAVLAGSLQGTKHMGKAGFMSLCLSGVLISLGFFCYTLSAGYNYLVENAVPLLSFTRQIQLGRFFQRFEAIYILLWGLSAGIAIGAVFYVSISIYCKIFRIYDHKPLIIPFLVLFFVANMSITDYANVLLLVELVRRYGEIVYFVLPFIIWLVAIVRRMEGKTQHG